MATTNIEWATDVWNPVAGCSIVSAGCKNCYAMRMAKRLEAMGQAKYADLTHEVNGHTVWTGQINLDRAALELPATWKKPRRVFVNSMSDLFHENVPGDFVRRVFLVMSATPQHTYMILTKRPERMYRFVEWLHMQDNIGSRWCDLFPNVWLGVSVEDQRAADERIPLLLKTPAAVRFLSCEPLLGQVDLYPAFCGYMPPSWGDGPDIHWVIAGGESGPGARPMNPDWARSLRDQCRDSGVSFFMKQIDKKLPIPDDLMIRQFPDTPSKRDGHAPVASQDAQGVAKGAN